MPYSVIFCGTPDFAVPSLRALVQNSDYRVQLVITQPDKPAGRQQKLTPSPVKEEAHRFDLPLWQPVDINAQWPPPHNPQSTDYIVVVAYGQLLSPIVLNVPRIAAVNLHASLLPRWRGAAPIQHALLEGDAQTGVTLQKMVTALDAGPVLAQETVKIRDRETASTLHDRLAETGANLLVRTLKESLTETQQNEEEVTNAPKLSRNAGNADPENMTATEIDRRVRALTPWPGVRCTIHGREVKLIETALEPADDAYALSCAGDTHLYITKLQPPGRRPMSGKEWERGIQHA